jgi:protein-tyrosine phosphatase
VGSPELQSGHLRTIYRSNTENVDVAAYPRSVAVVIDLRRDDEIAVLPHPLRATSGYQQVSLFDPAVAAESAPGARTLEDKYSDWLTRHSSTIGQVFHAIAAADRDVLICCSAGKDRTGVTSALLSRLWGADLPTIGADYAATGPALAERFQQERKDSTDLERTIRNQRCEPGTAIHLIRDVEDRFESVSSYLRWIGLSDREIELL